MQFLKQPPQFWQTSGNICEHRVTYDFVYIDIYFYLIVFYITEIINLKKKILLYILRITHTIQGGYQTHTHTTLDLRVDNFKTKFVSEFDRPALEHNTICKCSQ